MIKSNNLLKSINSYVLEDNTLKKESQVRKFYLLYLAVQALITSTRSFYVPYFASLGLSNTVIGGMNSIAFLTGFFGQIIFGYLIDYLGHIKKIFIVTTLLLAVSIFMLYIRVQSLAFLILFQGLAGFAFNNLIGLSDTWAMTSDENVQKNYGLIRSATSCSWALSSILLGFAVNILGYPVLCFFSLLMCGLVIYGTKAIPDYQGKGNRVSLKQVQELFKYKEYVVIVFIYFFTFMVVNGEMMLVSLKVAKLGTVFHFGFFFMMVGFSEIPGMVLFKRLLKRFPPEILLAGGIFGYILRLILFKHANHVILMYIIALVLGSVSFSMTYVSSRFLLKRVVPDHLYGTGMMVGFALTWGFTGAIISIFSGFLLDHSGMDVTFNIFILLAIGSLCLALGYVFYKKKNKS